MKKVDKLIDERLVELLDAMDNVEPCSEDAERLVKNIAALRELREKTNKCEKWIDLGLRYSFEAIKLVGEILSFDYMLKMFINAEQNYPISKNMLQSFTKIWKPFKR